MISASLQRPPGQSPKATFWGPEASFCTPEMPPVLTQPCSGSFSESPCVPLGPRGGKRHNPVLSSQATVKRGVGFKASCLPVPPPPAAQDLNQPLNGLQPGRVSSQPTSLSLRRKELGTNPARYAAPTEQVENFLPSQPPARVFTQAKEFVWKAEQAGIPTSPHS